MTRKVINIKELIRKLEAPFSKENRAVYCFCDNCHFVWEMSLDVFNKYAQDGSFGILDHLDDPEKFRRKYYFVFKICRNEKCIDYEKIKLNNKGLADILIIREINELRLLLENGQEVIESHSNFPDDPDEIILN